MAQEIILIGKLMVRSSAKGSEKIDAFAGWMLAAYAAVLAFMLGKIGELADYLAPTTLPMLVRLFLAAMVCAIVTKFVSLFISSLNGGAEAGDSAVKSMGGVPLNLDVLLAELEKSAWGLNKWGIRWAVKRMRQGDFACTGRLAGKALQLQSVLTLVQSAITFCAVWALYRGLVI